MSGNGVPPACRRCNAKPFVFGTLFHVVKFNISGGAHILARRSRLFVLRRLRRRGSRFGGRFGFVVRLLKRCLVVASVIVQAGDQLFIIPLFRRPVGIQKFRRDGSVVLILFVVCGGFSRLCVGNFVGILLFCVLRLFRLPPLKLFLFVSAAYLRIIIAFTVFTDQSAVIFVDALLLFGGEHVRLFLCVYVLFGGADILFESRFLRLCLRLGGRGGLRFALRGGLGGFSAFGSVIIRIVRRFGIFPVGKLFVVHVALPGRDAGSGLFQQTEINRRGGRRIIEIVVFLGNEAVDDRARIFPFRKILFDDLSSLLRYLKILSSPSVADAAPVGSDKILRFKPLQRAVQSRLFEGILPLAFILDLVYDLIPVLVSVVQCSQDDRVDVSADQFAADRGVIFGRLFFVFIRKFVGHFSYLLR